MSGVLSDRVTDSTTAPMGLLFSGGLDSSILLTHLLGAGHVVRPFYVGSGILWQKDELHAVHRILDAVSCPSLLELVTLELPLHDLYRDHWSITGIDVPHDGTADDAVYLPARNPLLIIKAAVWCQLHGIQKLALAVSAANPFADATLDFFCSLQQMLSVAGGRKIEIVLPLANMGKSEIMELAKECPVELSFSCLAPVGGRHCGACNKCAERRAAFRSVLRSDPTEYVAVRSGK